MFGDIKMIGDSFTFNNQTYTIKKELTLGEYKKINMVNSKLTELSQKYTNEQDLTKIPVEEQQKVILDFSKTSNEQLDIVGNFLERTLGLTQADIDNLSLTEAIQLFNEAFRKSSEVKKKPVELSTSLT